MNASTSSSPMSPPSRKYHHHRSMELNPAFSRPSRMSRACAREIVLSSTWVPCSPDDGLSVGLPPDSLTEVAPPASTRHWGRRGYAWPFKGV